ncbi:hypothetical protein KIN20_038312 [Parelaphostrongylus tenuis]|uniref:Uncharacterized protein n=1 Tax=Parelaphostrongylus tenuis TaxID=148309 RepID=A0AAD5RFA6_PARTN|nr:hypothetical protein KIN20_038312 [Parelaphostrongylus tenuis]
MADSAIAQQGITLFAADVNTGSLLVVKQFSKQQDLLTPGNQERNLLEIEQRMRTNVGNNKEGKEIDKALNGTSTPTIVDILATSFALLRGGTVEATHATFVAIFFIILPESTGVVERLEVGCAAALLSFPS